MTHEDLLKILDDQKIVRYRDYFIKTMKAAVNQVLDEAAEKATMKKVLKEDEKLPYEGQLKDYYKPKDKYAVMLTDSGAPTKLHNSYETAEAECLRLVEKTKQNGYVLKVVSEISLEPKINKLCQQ